jgi:hypothetical protein
LKEPLDVYFVDGPSASPFEAKESCYQQMKDIEKKYRDCLFRSVAIDRYESIARSSARSCSKSTDSRLIGAILITVPCQLRLSLRSDVSAGALFPADLTVSIRAAPCLVTAFNLLSSLPPGRRRAFRKETLSVFAAHFS